MAVKQVLIVDDEPDIREVAQLSLELGAVWTVWTAASGEEGVRKAREQQPDAILLDVMMPGMDGPATVRALRSDPAAAGIPVVLLTAKLQPSDRERFATLGVAGVIGKPFDPVALPGQVAETLEWPL